MAPPTPVAIALPRRSSTIPSPAATARPSLTKAHVVAIGDSVTAGTNCDCTPFPELYAKDLADKYDIKTYIRNDGQSGETSQDVLDDLRSDGAVQADIAKADIVVVTIGANDFGSEYDQGRGGTLRRRRRSGLRAGRSRPAAGQPDRDRAADRSAPRRRADCGPAHRLLERVRGRRCRQAVDDEARTRPERQADPCDESRSTTSPRTSEATYVDLYTPFKGADGGDDPTQLLADDGDHPNAAGHKLIAQTLLDAGTDPLTLG